VTEFHGFYHGPLQIDDWKHWRWHSLGEPEEAGKDLKTISLDVIAEKIATGNFGWVVTSYHVADLYACIDPKLVAAQV
jgi:hypothetical protein